MLGTAWSSISFSSSWGIFLEASGPGKRVRKLLVSLVVPQSAWKTCHKVYALRASIYASAWKVHSGGGGGRYSSKPSVIFLRWFLDVFPWSDSLLNSIGISTRSIIHRYLIHPEGEVVPVPSISILKFLSNTRNYSDWPSSKVDMIILCVSYMACEGFLWI